MTATESTETEIAAPEFSHENFDIDSLSQSQQIRLTHVLDAYLQSLEQGIAFDAASACRDEPALLAAVEVYLAKLKALYGLADSEQPLSAPIPQKLGAFTLIREIGRGGMGIVYEATQSGMERRVALKLLPLAATLDSRQIARFKNESRAAGGLHHPNIVPVYSVGEAEGVHYFAMQLIEGPSMDEWVQEQTSNSDSIFEFDLLSQDDLAATWETVVQWAIDAADALHYAHETGVIHRDIKPSNLILDSSGKIWITDFGLARCQTDLSLTRSGDVVGTMRYMSPEQASGQSALVDGRSDIYSLAVTIYEMLTLRPVHPGDDAHAILKRIDDHNIIPLRHFCDSAPRDLETVLAKAMSKHRDDRYETADQFASDLQRVLADEPTIARPATVVDRVARWASRHRKPVVASILVAAMGLVGFAISTALISAEKRVSDAHALRAKKSEQLARGAVDGLGSQVAELLSDIPAAEQVRRHLLAETLDYYETFAATSGDDPELRRTLAVTYGKIGSLHSQLGSTSKAIQALRTSEHLYGQLAEQTAQDVTLNMQWSVSQNNLAESLARAGELEEAARYFSNAIRLQETLLTTRSIQGTQKHDIRNQLATSLNNLGLLLADSGAIVESEERYAKAVELLTSHDNESGSDVDHQQLASVLSNLSALHSELNPTRAIAFARKALANQTLQLENDRGNARVATQVVVTLNTLGSAQLKAEQNREAAGSFEHAVEIGGQLLDRWPEQPTYRRDLVISLNHLGLALSKTGERVNAREVFLRALQQQRTLTKQFASDAETHSMLGGVLNNLGFLYRQMGDDAAAIDAYEEAVTHQTVAVDFAPEVERYRKYLDRHQQNLSELTQAISPKRSISRLDETPDETKESS
ncbi:protein kinase domain-containing protein [Novipirellula sp. SH528]|uniref:protein kinase domain-containing protein n=1 Tax=Novipirellula sp. SH528 TaxID=3454466 RepID=UPI003F9F9484